MKRRLILIELLIVLLLPSCNKNNNDMNSVIDKGIERSIVQVKYLAAELIDRPDELPKTLDKDGKLVTSDTHWWCSGFFPGTLWLLYDITRKDEMLKDYADKYTMRIEKEQYALDTHDLGFMMYCSFGNGYRITGNEHYRNVVLQSAKSLSTRYNENMGVIRSWDNKPKWQYPVIIDNLMNLELLEEAYKLSNEVSFHEIADSHAELTIQNHFRPDYSSYHVVDYDTVTFKVNKTDTHQGYAATSAWARGQAWGLYGYTMMYRETQKEQYLQQAINIARFILSHPNLPKDKIPYWDFDAPNIPDEERDASAGAIMASAFLELSQYVNARLSEEYKSVACTQLRTLTSDEYLAQPGTNGGFILKHSVGNRPANREVDVPLTYADYYYVEALLRYKKMMQ